MRENYKIVIITDSLPGFISNEVSEFEKMKIPIIIFADDLRAHTSISKTVQIVYSQKRIISDYVKVIFSLFFRFGILKSMIRLDANDRWLKFKIAFQWVLKVYQLEKMILDHVLIAPDTTIYSFWGNEKGLCASFLSQKYGVKGLTRLHGFDLYSERHHVNELPLMPYMIKHLSSIVFISQQGMSYFLKKYPFAQNKSALGYLGSTAPLPNTTPIERKPFHIVSCSYLIPLKRMHLLFEAVLKLREKNHEIHWTHFGGGYLHEEFKDKIKKHNAADYIDFVGNVPNEKIHEYYAQHGIDLFINVSETEGLPVSIIEACSYQIPIIATDVGGTTEIVLDGQNGFVLDKNLTAAELEACILKFILLPDKDKQKMRMFAFKIWSEKFQSVKNFEFFFKNILSIGIVNTLYSIISIV